MTYKSDESKSLYPLVKVRRLKKPSYPASATTVLCEIVVLQGLTDLFLLSLQGFF